MNKDGKKPELHLVDGQWMTAKEIAAMLGISYNALHCRRSRLGGCGMQCIVDMYRANQFGNTADRAPRYMIEGQWMTRTQIAGMLGIAPTTLSNWCWQNGGTMGEAVEHFRRWNEGGRKRNPLGLGGKPAKKYVVGNRVYTAPEVAKKYGVHVMSVRSLLKARNGDMGQVLRFYQAKARKRQARAEQEILRILGY